jgi:hypothetical protein
LAAQTVSVTNGIGLTSPAKSFAVAADNTAPTGGSTSYLAGYQSGAITVTFAVATDSGSGLGSYVLQKMTAPWTGAGCDTDMSSNWATIATNPAPTTYRDSLTAGQCVLYQTVYTDNVGNKATAIGSNWAWYY